MARRKDSAQNITHTSMFTAIAKDTGFTGAQVNLIVNTFFDHLKAKMASGISVHVNGFAWFEVVYRQGLVVRNPQNSEPAVMKPRFVPKAQMSKMFKNYVKDRLVAITEEEYIEKRQQEILKKTREKRS